MLTKQDKLIAFDRLLTIMDELREQCPWDKKQTFESLRYLTLEEAYELSDAIMQGNRSEIAKEAGDLLLHVVFYARLGSETGDFDIGTIINGLCDKLIHRHPHIYGDVIVENEEEVKQNWEKLKLKEGNRTVLSGVPNSLPAMIKASRIQEKARGVGFDWEQESQVWDKVLEELEEFKVESDLGEVSKMEDEFGDLLFSLINFARFKKINPEDALEKTNRKFMKRFNFIEKSALNEGRNIDELSLDEMERYWNEAKKN
jgi:XTP/dITP diphosphohydrolase